MRTRRLLAVAAAFGLLLAACSDSDSPSAGSSGSADATTTTTPTEDLIGDDAFRANCVTVEDEAELKVVEPACAYLASIVSHDGSKVPVADDAWRIEQGVNTGTSGPEIQESMSNDYFTTYVEGLRTSAGSSAGTRRSPTTCWTSKKPPASSRPCSLSGSRLWTA